jgi:hypothetical protein
MSRLSNPKVFVALLVALAVLFLLFVGCGATQDGGNARQQDRDPAPIRLLSVLLVDPLRGRVTVDDVEAPCRQASPPGFVLQINRPCSIQIGGSFRPVRTLALRLAQGGPAQVVLRPESGVLSRTTLNPGAQLLADIFREGARVDVVCPTACRLELR